MRNSKLTKKVSVIIVAIATILLIPGSVEAVLGNSKFEGNEDYWRDYCSKTFPSAAAAQECYEFQNYLTEKHNNIKDANSDLESKIAAIKGDISKVQSEAKKLQSELTDLENQIASLEKEIAALETQVSELQAKIDANAKAIKKKDDDIKARMVNSQSFVNTNGYIDFIMGASDFTDLLERISVMDQITTYENKQIESLNQDIKKLNNDKKEIKRQQELVDLQKEDIELKKADVEAKKRYQDALVAEYQKKEAELINEQLMNEAYMNQIIADMPHIVIDDGTLPPPSYGWGAVVSGYRSAGTWYYDGGGFHPGMDLAGAWGSPITAPISGVIGYTHDGESDQGYLGNPAGYANMIVLVGQVNGRTYAVLFGHLRKGGVAVSRGQVVSQGQVIGYRGTSGNSTGPHTHIEVWDLGAISVQAGLDILASKGYYFGRPYSPASICGTVGTPCRQRPENYIPY